MRTIYINDGKMDHDKTMNSESIWRYFMAGTHDTNKAIMLLAALDGSVRVIRDGKEEIVHWEQISA